MKLYLKTRDHSVSGEDFELRQASEKDMLITFPIPTDLEAYYQSDTYISHTDANKSLIDKVYQGVKKYSLKNKRTLIEKFSEGGKTLLDIGAGTGDFLQTAKEGGWQVMGVEPNAMARDKAAAKGVELYSELEGLPNQKFQIITLWHVLEHLPDLDAQILKIRLHLEERGTLVIAVPNFNSFDAAYYKGFWAAYDVPRHLWHFSRSAMTSLFSKYGLKLIATRPLYFDAFYVALLSEKYKTGKFKYLKAFWIGMRSNMKAFLTKEYSSIIYIFQTA